MTRKFLGPLLVLGLVLAALAPVRATAPRWTLSLGQIREQTRGYTIGMQFPKLSWPGRPEVARAFNAASRKPVDAALADFRREFSVSGGQGSGLPWDLRSQWETAFRCRALVSGVLVLSSFTGGAHPNPWLASLNFDLEKGRPLELGDLFQPGSGYLRLLSESCLAELRTRADEMTFAEDGAAPKAENYQVWTLGPKGLKVIFPPYQVAPYAVGTVEVEIPWGRLAGSLRPGSLADRLARGEF